MNPPGDMASGTPSGLPNVTISSWRASRTPGIPDDPGLPAMATLRSSGPSALIPSLDLGHDPVHLELCGYSPGSRATFEVRTGDHRFALKFYAKDPSAEVALYKALADAGFARDKGVRVPKLLAWEPSVRMVAISWLDGYPASGLIKAGRGRRAGTLAARWFSEIAATPVSLGPPIGPREVLSRCVWAAETLEVADHGLGRAASKVVALLRSSPPEIRRTNLVHGTLYSRHVLDLGDGPGIIDWDRFGQGPAEFDAGMFWATISRRALWDERRAKQTARAESAFLRGIRRLVQGKALVWYRAAALLWLAPRALGKGPAEGRLVKVQSIVHEADRCARLAARDGTELRIRDLVGGVRRRKGAVSDV